MHGHGPVLIGWLLTVVCAGTGTYCLARLRHRCVPRDRQNAELEALMGLGMAGMALPAGPLVAAPPEVPAALFAAVFAATAGWSLTAPGAAAGHRARHLLDSAAMVYMAWAMAGPGSHGGHFAVTAALLLYFAVYALVGAKQLIPTPATPDTGRTAPAPQVAIAPEVPAACRVTLALAMFAMLLTL